MNTTDLVHYISTGERPRPTASRTATPISYDELAAPLRLAILRARDFLFSARRDDGSWLGNSAGDASLSSQLVLLLAYLGEADSELAEHAVRAIFDGQLPSGGWSRTPSGPPDLSTSVQAYFAIKLSGHDPSDERLTKARDVIRTLGGADAADATTRFFLAIFGQVNYDCCPVIAPELLMFNERQRHRLAPLAVFWSHRPVRRLEVARGIRELFINKPSDWPAAAPDFTSQSSASFWQLATSVLYRCEHHGWTPLRERALKIVERALLQATGQKRLSNCDFYELVLTMIALDTLGHSVDSPAMVSCEKRLRELIVVEDCGDRSWPRLRTAPLADTALAFQAARASGVSTRQRMGPGASTWLTRLQRHGTLPSTVETVWLIDSLQAASSDSVEVVPSLPPDIQVDSGEFHGASTISVAALRRRARRITAGFATQLVDQQNPDGGWGPAAGNDSASSPDITAAATEALADHDQECHRHAIGRAIDYLRAQQRADGSWTSATGVRLVHGTSMAVRGLIAAGLPVEDGAIAAGLNWLVVHQQPAGGWGESPGGTSNGSDDYAVASVAATQTAWALLALVAAGRTMDRSARRAVQFLLDTQEDDGRWQEPHFVLRDVATGRWYRNELHAVAWPLLALSRWAVAASKAGLESKDGPALRLVGITDL